MKCTICKNEYAEIHEIHHGTEIHYICSKSCNDMLVDLDPEADAMILPDFYPDEESKQMNCSICKKDYPDIHEIHHGEEIHYMCSKSWNDMLADLDPTVDAMIFPDFCPDEESKRD